MGLGHEKNVESDGAEAGYCPQCGYFIVGLTCRTCPECGFCFERDELRKYGVNRNKALRGIAKVDVFAFGAGILVAILGRTLFGYLETWPAGETMYWFTNGKSQAYNVSVAGLPTWIFGFLVCAAFLRVSGLIKSAEQSRVYPDDLIWLAIVQGVIFYVAKIIIETIAFLD